MEHQQSKLTGSGIGTFTAGETITAITELHVGDLLTAFSPQFNALNLAKVTWIAEDRSHAYALFVDPQGTEKRRLYDDENFCIWDFEIGHACDLHRAVQDTDDGSQNPVK